MAQKLIACQQGVWGRPYRAPVAELPGVAQEKGSDNAKLNETSEKIQRLYDKLTNASSSQLPPSYLFLTAASQEDEVSENECDQGN